MWMEVLWLGAINQNILKGSGDTLAKSVIVQSITNLRKRVALIQGYAADRVML